jgi:hypothetical protein
MPDGTFTGDAFIKGDGQKHHRVRDHTGADSDLFVVLSQRVGPYEEYTPVHYVLEDLIRRLDGLENKTKVRHSFTGDAVIWAQYFTGDAIVKATVESSFTGDALVYRGATFTGDAFIRRAFTGDAYIIAPPP